MIEGVGSVLLTNGSGSRRLQNHTRILVRNTEGSQDSEISKFSFQDQVRQEQGKVKLRGKIAAEQVRRLPISCVLLVNLIPPAFSMYVHYYHDDQLSLGFLSYSFVVLPNFCVFF